MSGERQAFESIARASGFVDFETEDGRYADDFLQHFYLGWKAHQPAQQVPEVYQALEDLHRDSLSSFEYRGSPREKQVEAALSATPQPEAGAFQQRVQPWMMECFGPEISADKTERNHRFLEESLELVQSLGCTKHEAVQLVDYVYGREVGDPPQEVGGVMVTLSALCLASGLDMHQCGETELARIWALVAKIRAKQAAKPKHSPLPQKTEAGERWVRCEDRLPTKDDADVDQLVWYAYRDNVYRQTFDLVGKMSQAHQADMRWMPTGLTRPQPPKEQGE